MKSFVEFFRDATGFVPYEWQRIVAVKILEATRGVIVLRAETGSGKTEAIVIPGLYSGRQVLVVEPFRALVEDMADRLRSYLGRLSKHYGVPYSLAIDYGGNMELVECVGGECNEVATRKPFGADIYVTTMDELLYRLLSVATERKASIYAILTRLGTPLVFFDEVHSYTSELGNPFVTFMHEAVSLALYTPVVVASATIPDTVIEHLRKLVERNGLKIEEFNAPPKKKLYPKGMTTFIPAKGVNTIIGHVVNLLKKHRTVLVRTIVPEIAYDVYSNLMRTLRVNNAPVNVGIIHGRMPVKDRARVFKEVKNDLEQSRGKVVLVATPAIEAGVDLDFDAAVVELSPYRSLEQTLGRVNRHYSKKDAEIVVVDVDDEHWKLLDEESYLREARSILSQYANTARWEDVKNKLKQLDDKYTEIKLSTANMIDAYSSPYSRILAVSFHSLFHLDGTLLDYVIAIGKDEYETRGSLDITVEVEGEPGNYLRVPAGIAKKLGLKDGGRILRSMLKDHSYKCLIPGKNGATNKVEAAGLVI